MRGRSARRDRLPGARPSRRRRRDRAAARTRRDRAGSMPWSPRERRRGASPVKLYRPRAPDPLRPDLPPSVRVLVRGWLNCNQVVMRAPRDNVLVDSGYCGHREQTLERLASREGLDREPLERLVNTHCHSDPMGGYAADANAYGCRITIPAGGGKTLAAGPPPTPRMAQLDP